MVHWDRFFFNLRILREILLLEPSQSTRINVYHKVEHIPLKGTSVFLKPQERSAHLDIKTFDRHIKKLCQRGYVNILKTKPIRYELTSKAAEIVLRETFDNALRF